MQFSFLHPWVSRQAMQRVKIGKIGCCLHTQQKQWSRESPESREKRWREAMASRTPTSQSQVPAVVQVRSGGESYSSALSSGASACTSLVARHQVVLATSNMTAADCVKRRQASWNWVSGVQTELIVICLNDAIKPQGESQMPFVFLWTDFSCTDIYGWVFFYKLSVNLLMFGNTF